MKRLRYLSDDLPFDFNCGFVGYFGYELKADCEGDNAFESSMPDAAFVFADRLIAFDHYEKCLYLLCVTEPTTEDEGRRWISETAARLEALPPLEPVDLEAITAGGAPAEFRLSRSHQQYLDDIQPIKDYLTEGDTYEVCLTNKVHADISPEPLPLYRTLRHINPAPFSVLPALRRRRGPELLARALPLDRPRRLGGGQADQGHLPARQGPRRGPAARGDAADGREEPRREPDDHRPAAQRPRRRLRRRHGARAAPDGDRVLRDRAPAGVHDPRPAARGRGAAGRDPRLLPGRLDDRRPEEAHDGDHRRARARAARRLLRRDRLPRPERRLRPEHRDPDDRDGRADAPRSAPAARSSCSPTPRTSTRRCC